MTDPFENALGIEYFVADVIMTKFFHDFVKKNISNKDIFPQGDPCEICISAVEKLYDELVDHVTTCDLFDVCVDFPVVVSRDILIAEALDCMLYYNLAGYKHLNHGDIE